MRLTADKGSNPPHLHAEGTTSSIMWSVILCLLPAGLWGIWLYGLRALLVVAIAIASALVCEWITGRFVPGMRVADGSALLTGLLVGYNLPPTVPFHVPALASFFAIVVVKGFFGGLGANWMNPALGGRLFAFLSWPAAFTTWSAPRLWPATTGLGTLTPLAASVGSSAVGPVALLAQQSYPTSPWSAAVASWLSQKVGFSLDPHYLDLLAGTVPGNTGEVSVVLLLLGTIYLFRKRIITWSIPLSFLWSFALLIWIFGGLPGGGRLFSGDVVFHLFSGGVVLGAFFMATDPVTSPSTRRGAVIFGIGAGGFAFLIRMVGEPTEAVAFAIVLMNIAVPAIDRLTRRSADQRQARARGGS